MKYYIENYIAKYSILYICNLEKFLESGTSFGTLVKKDALLFNIKISVHAAKMGPKFNRTMFVRICE